MIKQLFILFLVLASWNLVAQQPSYFMFAQKEFEGVDIYDVIQDKEFNYYFATDQGILKHDGYNFEKIECNEMSGGSVFHFVMNQFGTIYCYNLNKQVFQIKNSICKLIYTIPDVGNDINLIVTADNHLLISSSKNIYILDDKNTLVKSTDFAVNGYISEPFNVTPEKTILHESGSNCIWTYENKKLTKTKVIQNEKVATTINGSLQFYQFNNHVYGISTVDKKVFQLDKKTLSLKYIKEINWNPITEKVRFYGVDKYIWIASNISGVIKVPNKIEAIKNDTKLFQDYFISDIFKDREGNILLSTFDEGIIVVPNLKVNDVEEIFKSHFITKLHSRDNQLFLGTRDGLALRYTTQLKEISNSGSKGVETLSKWPNKEIVISDNGGFSIVNLTSNIEKQFNIGSLKDVAYIDNDRFFAAMNVGLYEFSYDEKTQEIIQLGCYMKGRMYDVEYEKKSETIYASTFDGLKYIDKNRKLHSILVNGKSIQAIGLCSTNGKTYISTRKNGVLVLQKGKIIDQFYPKHNYESLVVLKINVHNSTIYANTQIGFVIMNLKGEIQHYLNKSSGLSTNKIIDFAITENNLWIAHARGVQRFNISEITTKVKVPELLLRKVIVKGSTIKNLTSKGSFNATQNKLKFVLEVPTLKHRENIRYHYKLEGNNEQWHINTYENNEIIYNALGAGNYRFLVRAENNGVFSKTISYSFVILAPFYQRTWFIILMVIILISIVSLIYRRQLKIQQKKAQQINELNASRLTAIQSQMNPHFIFNSLNSIQDLVLKGDVDNSYTFITKFSNLVRRTLNYSDKDFIEFEQEIKLIELYLSLEKLRFKENIEFTIETNDIDDILIPPMLIQPFIENALVHGLLHKEGLKKLEIKFSLSDTLICTITDNGVGRQKAREIKERQRSAHESFAVNAIKKRFEILENHFKGNLGYYYEDLIEKGTSKGTKVTLKIPFKNKF